MGFNNYGAGYVNDNPLGSQSYQAGATRLKIGLEAPGLRYRKQSGKDVFITSFASGGAKLQKSGGSATISVTNPGEDRVVALIKAERFRQVSGHTPKVWYTSESKNEGGLLVVADSGFIFESTNFRGGWRRFLLTPTGIEEIPVEEEVID